MNTAFKRAGGRMLEAKGGFFLCKPHAKLAQGYLFSLFPPVTYCDTVEDQGTYNNTNSN